GKFGLNLFEKLDSDVLIERLDVQKLAIGAITDGKQQVDNTTLWLIAATAVKDWKAEGDPNLKGHGYLLQFATAKGGADPVQLDAAPATQTNPYTRLWQELDQVH